MTNNKPIMKTPITYYGGKQKMLGAILPMIPEHNIYVEPFFGGGAVFWAKQPAPVEFINDIDGEVTNFYRVLQTDYPALKREVDSILHSEHAHREARAIYRSPEGHSPVRRAWAVWTLSHQSFYAILDNTWKCGMTHNVAGQIQGRKASFTADYTRRLEHTSIFSRDALTVIRRADRPETFFYVDPPYFNSDMGHYGGYTEEDFGRLLEVLSEVKGRFMLSSYPSELLTERTATHGWHTVEVEQQRSAGGGRKIEVLTMNYDPSTLTPAPDPTLPSEDSPTGDSSAPTA